MVRHLLLILPPCHPLEKGNTHDRAHPHGVEKAPACRPLRGNSCPRRPKDDTIINNTTNNTPTATCIGVHVRQHSLLPTLARSR